MCAAAAVAMHITGGAAVVRTIILAVAAVALAFVARKWSLAEAWQRYAGDDVRRARDLRRRDAGDRAAA
jgi:hypothetical protein